MKLRIKTDAKQFDESKPDQNKEQIDDAMEDSQEAEPETLEQEPVAPHSQVHTNLPYIKNSHDYNLTSQMIWFGLNDLVSVFHVCLSITLL